VRCCAVSVASSVTLCAVNITVFITSFCNLSQKEIARFWWGFVHCEPLRSWLALEIRRSRKREWHVITEVGLLRISHTAYFENKTVWKETSEVQEYTYVWMYWLEATDFITCSNETVRHCWVGLCAHSCLVLTLVVSVDTLDSPCVGWPSTFCYYYYYYYYSVFTHRLSFG